MNINYNQLAISNPKTFAFGVAGLILSTVSLGSLAINCVYKLIDKYGAKISYKDVNILIQKTNENKGMQNNKNSSSNKLEEN